MKTLHQLEYILTLSSAIFVGTDWGWGVLYLFTRVLGIKIQCLIFMEIGRNMNNNVLFEIKFPFQEVNTHA